MRGSCDSGGASNGSRLAIYQTLSSESALAFLMSHACVYAPSIRFTAVPSRVSPLILYTQTESSIISHQSSIINHQSSIINHQSSIINHQSSIINHQSSIINHQSSIINHQSSIINHQSSIINHQSSIINHQSSIINHQSSIINHQSSIINHQSSIINHQSGVYSLAPPHTFHGGVRGHLLKLCRQPPSGQPRVYWITPRN